jgi:multicomponent Na+:H+ antiporter subunit B
MKRVLAAVTIAAVALPLLLAVSELPRPGAADAPVHRHVAAHYLAEGVRETGADNAVTGVLLNYRAFDTFGEVMIIFTALAAVMAVLLPRGQPGAAAAAPPLRPVPVSPLVAFMLRLTAPFIAAFAIWVILKGHLFPGGGFQGGAILGALGILLTIVLGGRAARPRLAAGAARWLQASGPLAFALVALAGLWLTGHVLGYPVDPALHATRSLLMLLLEIGIGLGGAAIILGLFLELRGD